MYRRLPALLAFTATLLLAAPASAVTAHVCVRNDGVGTFEGGDLALFADSDWNAGDTTGSGPGYTTVPPGDGHCMQMTGLLAWNGYQYAYVFEISFWDTSGLSYFYSPGGLQLSNGTWYISTLGATAYDPGLASYISISNDSTATDDDDAANDDDSFAVIDDYEGDQPGECDDGADNDRDGDFDCDDEGCFAAPACEPGTTRQAGGCDCSVWTISATPVSACLAVLLLGVLGSLRRRC